MSSPQTVYPPQSSVAITAQSGIGALAIFGVPVKNPQDISIVSLPTPISSAAGAQTEGVAIQLSVA